MCIPSSALNTILGGFIAASVGFALAWWKRKRDGRDRFLAVLGEIESELDGSQPLDNLTQKVHSSSIAPLRGAIFSVQPFVTRKRFKMLLNLWHDYKNENFDPTTAVVKMVAHDMAGKPQSQRPGYPDSKLRNYFDKFRKVVA